MSNSSIWSIDKALSGATTPGQNGPGSNGNERVLHFPQSSKKGPSPSDGLMSYPGHSLRDSYVCQCILQLELTGLEDND